MPLPAQGLVPPSGDPEDVPPTDEPSPASPDASDPDDAATGSE
jgi:hypothetical protein